MDVAHVVSPWFWGAKAGQTHTTFGDQKRLSLQEKAPGRSKVNIILNYVDL